MEEKKEEEPLQSVQSLSLSKVVHFSVEDYQLESVPDLASMVYSVTNQGWQKRQENPEMINPSIE